MAEFNPEPSDTIKIGAQTFRVQPHPMVPSFAFGQEGRKAFVFKVENTSRHKNYYALKKFKHAYRLANLVDVCQSLAQFAHLPGMGVCRRECITEHNNQTLLREYTDLEFAVLMPWMNGSTWYDFIVNETAIDLDSSLQIAWKTSLVLAGLEEAGLAHCDIAAPNVIIDLDGSEVHLVDVEDLFAPDMQKPQAVPAGTDGYNHHTAGAGQWGPFADRFAGAVLLAEMLGWHNPDIREQADGEHYFSLDDLQQDCDSYHLLHTTLHDIQPVLADLFEEAWYSPTMEDCPPLQEWADVIDPLARPSPVKEWVPLTAYPRPAAAHPGNWKQAKSAKPKTVTLPTVDDAPRTAYVSIAQPPAPGGPLLGFEPIAISTPPPSNGDADSSEPLSALSKEAEDAAQTTSEADSESSAGKGQPQASLAKSLKSLAAPHLSSNQPQADGSYTLNWQPVPDATYYVIQESSSMGFFGGKQSTVADSTQWPVSNRDSGTYYYRVRAHTDADFGEWSNIVFIKVKAS